VGFDYGIWWLLSSSALRCECSSTRYAWDNSLGSLPLADSDWLVRAGLDKARTSSRISASRSGGSGDTLINVIDAADSKLCLHLPSFLRAKAGIRMPVEPMLHTRSVPSADFALLAGA